MEQLLLRGYFTPEDFGGDIQAALDEAAQCDLGKVVLSGSYTVDRPVVIPGGMYLVFQDARISARGDFPVFVTEKIENYAFAKKWISLEGYNSVICGDAAFFNTAHVTVKGLQLEGCLSFEYTVWGNLEELTFSGNGFLKLGRGCSNFIIQNLRGCTQHTPVQIAGDFSCGSVVPGTKPDLQNIVLQDSQFDTPAPAVQLRAAEDCGVLNIQVDHIRASAVAVEVGQDMAQPPELFFNLTFTDLDAPEKVIYRNPAKHVYEK